jgi:hypothetical protein
LPSAIDVPLKLALFITVTSAEFVFVMVPLEVSQTVAVAGIRHCPRQC